MHDVLEQAYYQYQVILERLVPKQISCIFYFFFCLDFFLFDFFFDGRDGVIGFWNCWFSLKISYFQSGIYK